MKSLSDLIESSRMGPNLSRIIEGHRSRRHGFVSLPELRRKAGIALRSELAAAGLPARTPQQFEMLLDITMRQLTPRWLAAKQEATK